MLLAPPGPKVIKDETIENVEGLPDVRETSSVVSLDAKSVVFSFEDGFTEQDERQ
jgi:hypothetical protein